VAHLRGCIGEQSDLDPSYQGFQGPLLRLALRGGLGIIASTLLSSSVLCPIQRAEYVVSARREPDGNVHLEEYRGRNMNMPQSRLQIMSKSGVHSPFCSFFIRITPKTFR
jgi:hypothetical protein